MIRIIYQVLSLDFKCWNIVQSLIHHGQEKVILRGNLHQPVQESSAKPLSYLVNSLKGEILHSIQYSIIWPFQKGNLPLINKSPVPGDLLNVSAEEHIMSLICTERVNSAIYSMLIGTAYSIFIFFIQMFNSYNFIRREALKVIDNANFKSRFRDLQAVWGERAWQYFFYIISGWKVSIHHCEIQRSMSSLSCTIIAY